MAKDLNLCSFIGRLGKDVETRQTPAGKEVANFSIAVNSFKEDETLWLNVVAWEKLAGICSQYLSKGSQVHISGRLVIRSYDDKEGVKKYITELVAENLQMLGGKSDSNQNQSQSTQGSSQSSGSSWGSQPVQQTTSGNQQSNFNDPPFNPDDDIPF